MAPGGGELVLLDHAYLPVTILHVLLEESAQRVAGPIPTPDSWALVDFASAAGDAQVVFVILIAHQLLVKEVELLESAARPAAVSNRVYGTLKFGVVKPGSTDGEWRVVSRSNRLLQVSVGLCSCRAADVVRTGLLQNLKTTQ